MRKSTQKHTRHGLTDPALQHTVRSKQSKCLQRAFAIRPQAVLVVLHATPPTHAHPTHTVAHVHRGPVLRHLRVGGGGGSGGIVLGWRRSIAAANNGRVRPARAQHTRRVVSSASNHTTPVVRCVHAVWTPVRVWVWGQYGTQRPRLRTATTQAQHARCASTVTVKPALVPLPRPLPLPLQLAPCHHARVWLHSAAARRNTATTIGSLSPV